MVGDSLKKQANKSHERLNNCYSRKRVFLALCLFMFGILLVILTPRSMDVFRRISFSPLPSSSYVKGVKRISPQNDNTATAGEPHVNAKPGHLTATKNSNAFNSTSRALQNLSPHMREQVEFLRDAIEKAHHEDLHLAKEPKCKGDRVKGEVEDMLCIPRPAFIKDVRNPCWWGPPGEKSELHCIPYFHILGCEKCGSSDLWARITSHPHTVPISGINHKEANWWGWGRYGRFHYSTVKVSPFVPGYARHFQQLTDKVKKSLESGNDDHKHLITGDGTPSDLCDFRGWVNITQNRGLELPEVLTPHLMKHIYPNTTNFIVLFRDPIERLYSDFCYASGGRSPAQFHTNLLGAINVMANCIRKRSVRKCFFDLKMYRSGVVRLHLILYTLYLKEWLKVIPRERFLFLKTEEYGEDTFGTLKKCFKFLNLEPLDDKDLLQIAKRPHFLKGEQKKRAGPMWRSTKDILEEIVRPSMHFLPELLNDDRFTWDFKLTSVVEH